MDKEKAMEYAMQEVYRKIIMQYLFIISLEEKKGDENIERIYRINPRKIRTCYDIIPKEEREILENEIKEKIKKRKLNLNEEAAKWHNDNLKSKMMGEERDDG